MEGVVGELLEIVLSFLFLRDKVLDLELAFTRVNICVANVKFLRHLVWVS